VTAVVVLEAPAAVTCRVPFVVTADVTPVPHASRVTVTLWDRARDGSPGALQSVEVVAQGDTAFASFQLALPERGSVLLLATAHDGAGAPARPDGVVVEVL
jgi:hypothetical protein